MARRGSVAVRVNRPTGHRYPATGAPSTVNRQPAPHLLLLLRQGFPFAIEKVDHGFDVSVLRLDLSRSLAVAVDLLAAKEQVIALALGLGRGDARFELGDLLVDLLDPLLAFLRLDACGAGQDLLLRRRLRQHRLRRHDLRPGDDPSRPGTL